jgi:hypothetical protein
MQLCSFNALGEFASKHEDDDRRYEQQPVDAGAVENVPGCDLAYSVFPAGIFWAEIPECAMGIAVCLCADDCGLRRVDDNPASTIQYV